MKNKYKIHIIGLAHLPATQEYMSCAFTQKNRKICKMLVDLGHDVVFYGAQGSDVLNLDYKGSGTIKFVQTHLLEDIRRDYGNGDNRFQIGYDWRNGDFRHDFNSSRKISTTKMIASVIDHLKTAEKDDFLYLTQGFYQKPIADAANMFLTVEGGIGYRGSFARFRAFESAYIQNFTYGSEHPYDCINGNYYDRVIPNYFDEDDVLYSKNKGDYYLFIGRMIRRKGIVTAYMAAKALKKKLIIAGQGARVNSQGYLEAIHDTDFSLPPDGTWEYVGYADVVKRKNLMAHAKVVFAPTEYLECFAGTHIEAMLSGTPVITTDFGVFAGTVINGVNGYRCSTLQDFVDAAKKAEHLDPAVVRKSAEQYLSPNVALLYQKWFDDLHNVWESSVSDVGGWSRLSE